MVSRVDSFFFFFLLLIRVVDVFIEEGCTILLCTYFIVMQCFLLIKKNKDTYLNHAR